MIKVIKMDVARGQDATNNNLKTMFHNAAVFSHGDLLACDAVKDAVKTIRAGKKGLVQSLIESGEWERGEYSDPRWTGD